MSTTKHSPIGPSGVPKDEHRVRRFQEPRQAEDRLSFPNSVDLPVVENFNCNATWTDVNFRPWFFFGGLTHGGLRLFDVVK